MRAGWLVVACGLMLLLARLLDTFLLGQVPLRASTPILNSAGMPTDAEWPGNNTRSISWSSGTTLTSPVRYSPPSRLSLGFMRPWATASFTATLVAPSGTWEAPPGTMSSEIIERTRAAGHIVTESFLEVPSLACEEFFGLECSEQPTVGNYWHICAGALAYDLAHGWLLLSPIFLALAFLRLFLTTRAERSRLRALAGLCGHCRYQLVGIPDGAPCPECGTLPTK
jgi:hypothetical protein